MIIIDPPVDPSSTPEEITAWLAKLASMLEDTDDPEEIKRIEEERDRVTEWLS